MHPILTGLFLLAVTGHHTPVSHSTTPHLHARVSSSAWADVRRRLSVQDAEIALLRQQLTRQDTEIAQIRRQMGQKAAEVVPPTHRTRQLALPATNVYDLVLSGAYPQAAGAADDLLARDPDNAEAQALKAIAFIKMGQADSARPAAAAALQLTDGQERGRPRALALIAEGLLAETANEASAATQAYQSAGNIDQSLGLTYLVFAGLLHTSGKDGLAKRMLQTGLTQNPTPEETNAIQSTLSKF